MSDHAREVRQSLTDPGNLCMKLGWLDGHKRQARGVLIRCPSHGEKDPSCSVTTAPDGTIRIKCFACDFAGDALTMVAFAHNLSLTDDFREVLATGAELAGNLGLADEVRGDSTAERAIARPRRPAPALAPVPEPEYPPADELARLWASCGEVAMDGETVKMLMGRGIDFAAVDELRLARVIPVTASLPRWARYRGESWVGTGHRLALPAWDAWGQMRSVRAWRVCDGDTPKRLPPGGCKAAELVQANVLAVKMLRRWASPLRLVIVEGEPDFLTWATVTGAAVVGVGSGSWTEEHARRVPPRTEVVVRTHADRAGEKYAEHIAETLKDRCPVWRMAS